MRRRNETRQATLQLFFLENSDKDQAAWVRASTGREACISLSKTTDIPIYGMQSEFRVLNCL